MWAAEQFPDDALPQGGTGNSSATGGCGAQKLRVLAARHKLAGAEAALQDAQNRSTTNTPTASNAATVSTQPSIWQFVASRWLLGKNLNVRQCGRVRNVGDV